MMRTVLLLALLLASPPAYAGDENPFSDFRLSGSVLLGAGSTPSTGTALAATAGLSVYVPLIQNLGLTAGADLFSRPNLDPVEGGGAYFVGVGGGLDYTIGLGKVWGLGLAAGAQYVPFGNLEVARSSPRVDLRGVSLGQEIALRRIIGIGLWEAGVRAHELLGAAESVVTAGAFFRFSFRL